MLTITFYEARVAGLAGTKWYWQAKAANGEIIADGGQGYADEDNARHGFNVLKLGLAAEEGYRTEVTRLV